MMCPVRLSEPSRNGASDFKSDKKPRRFKKSDRPLSVCHGCKKTTSELAEGEKFRLCSRCQTVQYCSRACAGADWAQHKANCKEDKLQSHKEYQKAKAARRMLRAKEEVQVSPVMYSQKENMKPKNQNNQQESQKENRAPNKMTQKESRTPNKMFGLKESRAPKTPKLRAQSARKSSSRTSTRSVLGILDSMKVACEETPPRPRTALDILSPNHSAAKTPTHSAAKTPRSPPTPGSARSQGRWARGPDAPNAVGFATRVLQSINFDSPHSKGERKSEANISTSETTPEKKQLFQEMPSLPASPVSEVASDTDAVPSLDALEEPQMEEDVSVKEAPVAAAIITPGVSVEEPSPAPEPICWAYVAELHKKFRVVIRKAVKGGQIHVHDLKLCLDLFDLESRDQPDLGLQRQHVEAAIVEHGDGEGEKMKLQLSAECLAQLQAWHSVLFQKKEKRDTKRREEREREAREERERKEAAARMAKKKTRTRSSPSPVNDHAARRQQVQSFEQPAPHFMAHPVVFVPMMGQPYGIYRPQEKAQSRQSKLKLTPTRVQDFFLTPMELEELVQSTGASELPAAIAAA